MSSPSVTPTYEGSLGGTPLNAPVAGAAVTGDGKGYWLVAADGGVFAFGDAVFAGSAVGSAAGSSASPAVGLAAPTGGYWVAHADGTVSALGTTSLGQLPTAPSTPVVGIAASAPHWWVGHSVVAHMPGVAPGYWMAGGDGGVFGYGSAHFAGSMSGSATGRAHRRRRRHVDPAVV